MTSERDKAVAAEILRQLGGSRFVAMTGATNMAYDGPSLSFRLPSRFAKLRGVSFKVVSEVSGVYAEDLRRVFESETGLVTSL